MGLCRMGSWEAELFIEPVPGSVIVTKPRFDVWQSPEFLGYLAARSGRWLRDRGR